MKTFRSLALLLAALGTLGAAAALRDRTATEGPPPHADGVLEALRGDGPMWWKGNLHTHSLWSDGDDFPEMIADWFKRHEYHFLTLSDHNVLSEGDRWVKTPEGGTFAEALAKYEARFGAGWVQKRQLDGKTTEIRLKPLAEFRSMLEEPGRFLMIQGEEITHRFGQNPVHLNGINLKDVIPPVDGGTVAETITVNYRAVAEQAKRQGRPMLAFLNHPNFGWGVSVDDLAAAEGLLFFEVFNGHPSVGNYGDKDHPSTERMWDEVLARRLGKLGLPVLYGLATDDSHRYHRWGVGQVNPGRAWVMVKAPYLTAGAIVEAMTAGDFYCSTGVTLRDIRREGDSLRVSVRPADGVKYRIQFIGTKRDSDRVGEVLAETEGTEAGYELTGDDLYVRVKVISDKPHPNPYREGDTEVAWTQPFTP